MTPSNSRKSPIEMSPIRLAGSALGRQAHICAFFNSRDDEYEVLLPFIKEGLELGEKAVHTVDPRRRNEHLERLASAGVDLNAVQNDQFELRDWGNTHLRGGRFDPQMTLALFEEVIKDAKQGGFPLIRLITHMEWAVERNWARMSCWNTRRGQTRYGFAKMAQSTRSFANASVGYNRRNLSGEPILRSS